MSLEAIRDLYAFPPMAGDGAERTRCRRGQAHGPIWGPALQETECEERKKLLEQVFAWPISGT